MQALDQIRVVEIGPGVAVAFAGKTFADFGADVIKVEAPDGDPRAGWDRSRRTGRTRSEARRSGSSTGTSAA